MPRPIKTREKIASQFYLNTTDIMVLIGKTIIQQSE